MAAEFEISKADLKGLRGNVIVVTGASSGIGLATTKLLLELGALVVAGDLNPVPLEDPNLAFQKVNVTSWEEQLKLFQKATSLHSTIDHVFANAGVKNHTAYIEDVTDKNGQPVKPDMSVIDINLKGALYTTVLGYHHLKKKGKGSIVITASTSSYMRFPFADYGIAKHGTLALMRAMSMNSQQISPSIRVNAIAPSWTATGIADATALKQFGLRVQGPEVPAYSAALLMADTSRQGQLIYSSNGKLAEIDDAILSKGVRDHIIDIYQPGEELALRRMFKSSLGLPKL